MSPVRRRIAVTMVAVGVLVALVIVADGRRRLFDLTETDALTLSAQTRDIVRSLDEDVDITVFIRRSQPGRVEAVTLLDRYRRLNRRIDVEVLDPDDAPGELSRLGVDPLLGGVAVSMGDDVERVPFATEGDLTGALARLVRDDDVFVCATTGHGERSIDDEGPEGLSETAALLERDGYVVAPVDLLATPEIPERCSVMVVAAPEGEFGRRAEQAVEDWVEDDGRLLLLTDPVPEDVPFDRLLDGLGIGIERGVVLEGDSARVVGGDISAPIVTRYPSANPVVRGLAPTFFPVAQEVVVDDSVDDEGLSTGVLAQTSDLSYLEREPVAAEFDPSTDRPGPITVVGAADRSRIDGVDIRRTRVLVTGDVDFAANRAVREAANAQLLRRGLAWLTETEDLVAISPNLPEDRPLRLTDARANYALVLSAGVVPGLFLLAGALVWALRRGR